MIEFDESEYLDCAMTDEELYLVRLFNGPTVGDKLLYKWGDIHNYSGELQQVIQIITDGRAPGKGA